MCTYMSKYRKYTEISNCLPISIGDENKMLPFIYCTCMYVCIWAIYKYHVQIYLGLCIITQALQKNLIILSVIWFYCIKANWRTCVKGLLYLCT